MKEKATVRYLGQRTLADGGRGFDFSVALIGEGTNLNTIEASADLFWGPDRIAIQEAAGRLRFEKTLFAGLRLF